MLSLILYFDMSGDFCCCMYSYIKMLKIFIWLEIELVLLSFKVMIVLIE